MTDTPYQLTLEEWDAYYASLVADGLKEPAYGGPISRHLEDGDLRLQKLRFDNAPEALRLWNFLLTEEDRLKEARSSGKKIVGTMKDLGTVPILAYAFPNITAFYPDGAWWIPCVMELSAGLLGVADTLGFDESFCPVRAMLGAFVTGAHFPIPDHLICSVGATCDDFSAIAQRLSGLGFPVQWWEIPHRRHAQDGEGKVGLPGDLSAPESQVAFVRNELETIKNALENLAGMRLTDEMLLHSIRFANQFRTSLETLRQLTFTSPQCPLPALEILIAEMLAIHYCSDRDEALKTIEALVYRAKKRIGDGTGYFGHDAVKVFWVNPVADLSAMNLLESCGGRICGTEYLFTHALDPIPEDIAPMEALARMALADPMVGSGAERAARIIRDMQKYGSEACIVSRIPGASHCAFEGELIASELQEHSDIPVLECEIPPVCDGVEIGLRTRISALLEIARERRKA
jgi:benzoyl-CoA reductase/2-hydroxyglutaryl-CoA dehydratase subunit BcrC/BadD/HgdB